MMADVGIFCARLEWKYEKKGEKKAFIVIMLKKNKTTKPLNKSPIENNVSDFLSNLVTDGNCKLAPFNP